MHFNNYFVFFIKFNNMVIQIFRNPVVSRTQNLWFLKNGSWFMFVLKWVGVDFMNWNWIVTFIRKPQPFFHNSPAYYHSNPVISCSHYIFFMQINFEYNFDYFFNYRHTFKLRDYRGQFSMNNWSKRVSSDGSRHCPKNFFWSQ